MNTRQGAVVAVLASLASFAPAAAWAGPTLAIEYSGANEFLQGSINISEGWKFTTTEAIEVTALDVFDPSGDGDVRLYNTSGTTLASVTLSTSDPTEGAPTSFYTASIVPVLLAANTTYYVVEDMIGNTTNIDQQVTGFTTASGITYDGAVNAVGTGQNPMTDLEGGTHNPAFFGPNFDFTPASVPEPAGLTALLSGLLGLGLVRRFRRNR